MGAKFRQPPFSVAEATIISKSITANGTYNASSDSADGYNPVTVVVPEKTIVSKNITANGTYNASSDSADGYNPVTVAVRDEFPAIKVITNSTGGYDASLDIIIGHTKNDIFVADESPITLIYTDARGLGVDYGNLINIRYDNEWQIRNIANAVYNYNLYNGQYLLKSWLYSVSESIYVTQYMG